VLEGRLARLGSRRLAVLLALACVAVYAGNGKTLSTGDSVPAGLIPIALVLDGTPMLDRFRPALPRGGPTPYYLEETPRGLASWYPPATGLLATPIVAPLVLWLERTERPDPARWVAIARTLEKVAATVIATAAVLLFHGLCHALGVARVPALLLTLVFAFGSEMLSTAAQALWQHGPGVLALLAALRFLVAARSGGRGAALVGFATMAALAIAIRPSNALVVAPFVALALGSAPHRRLELAAPLVVVGGLLLAYNWLLFGQPAGGYAESRGFGGDLADGLLGVLVSPGRGLLVYFPVTLLLVAAVVLDPGILRDGFAAASLAALGGSIVLVAAWHSWWGGYSYGPRLLSEVQPLVLLVVGIAIVRAGSERYRRLLIAALVVLLPLQAFVQALGSYGGPAGEPPPAVMWNATPVSVDEAPERNWSVVDSPIVRGARALWR